MCIIVDTDRTGEFFSDPPHPDARPIHEWIRTKGRLVYSTGGRFGSELGGPAKRRLGDYFRTGMAKRIPYASFRDDERQLEETGNLRSNDAHILALARRSGARLLYTGDQDLMKDFKDGKVITGPRGRVYSDARNRRLLTRKACPR